MICPPKFGERHRSQTPDLTPIPHLYHTLVGALLVGILNIIICESANTNVCGGNDCCLDGTSGGGYLKCGHGKFLINSNLDITNKSVRPFLFTISNNSLYQK